MFQYLNLTRIQTKNKSTGNLLTEYKKYHDENKQASW